ncbi:NAD(P)H-dependent oxidoreductase [Irregularibacter muris]|uniref:NAD(P)H-dependent oxidoreductase n=1 Tax=Irregularibacter muris TaxID=1796619 RepID=A0AAE3L024_9FIRM|nr:NAD(P)H-dependent oxidoreductase [Irregularibacter muris]MCR1900120.1 NAD(P)H-dependent oxidoreductase [Irregularibacter muris]
MKKRLIAIMLILSLVVALAGCAASENSKGEENQQQSKNTDSEAGASTADGETSASLLPEDLVKEYKPKGFTDGEAKKAMFIVGDPRKYSVNYDLVYTAMKHFEEKGVEVELRDLYDINFNPVITKDNFYYAKDGAGEPSAEIKKEQDFVTKADYIIFCYPNWHDTPTAIVKGYMESVFAKQFAYRDTQDGLEGLLKDKSIYTIMNAGFLGGGRGYIGDGVGIDDEAWDEYMKAFKVFDDDTAGFWGVQNKGRFVNDRTPANNSENYKEELEKLREDLVKKLDKDFF